MEQADALLRLLQDETLKREMEKITILMNDQLLALLRRVYQAGIEEGWKQAQNEVYPTKYRSS